MECTKERERGEKVKGTDRQTKKENQKVYFPGMHFPNFPTTHFVEPASKSFEVVSCRIQSEKQLCPLLETHLAY
jgi:hypothetical protein